MLDLHDLYVATYIYVNQVCEWSEVKYVNEVVILSWINIELNQDSTVFSRAA